MTVEVGYSFARRIPVQANHSKVQLLLLLEVLDYSSTNTMSSSDDESGCVMTSLSGLATGFIGGSLLGAIFSNWSDEPLRMTNNKALPALQKTGQRMMQHGSTLGAVGLAFAAVDCAVESVRGEKDWVNGVCGGVAGGAIIGLRSGNPRMGVASMAALAVTSLAIDASGRRLTGPEYVADGLTPERRVFPYSNSSNV